MQVSDFNTPPIVDHQKFEEFCEMFTMENVSILVQKVPTSMLRRLDDIHKNIEIDDAQGVQREFHSIKGASAQLFGTRLSEEAARLENMSHDFDAVKDALPKFEEIMRETLDWWMSHTQEIVK